MTKIEVREKLARVMGWCYEEPSHYNFGQGAWFNDESWCENMDYSETRSDAPPNSYESEADNAALIDWMVSQNFKFILSSSYNNPYDINATEKVTYCGFGHPCSIFRTVKTGFQWSDRKTAITECAAEALGIPPSQDSSE